VNLFEELVGFRCWSQKGTYGVSVTERGIVFKFRGTTYFKAWGELTDCELSAFYLRLREFSKIPRGWRTRWDYERLLEPLVKGCW